MKYEFNSFDIIVAASSFFLHGRGLHIEGATVFVVGSLISGGIYELIRNKKPS